MVIKIKKNVKYSVNICIKCLEKNICFNMGHSFEYILDDPDPSGIFLLDQILKTQILKPYTSNIECCTPSFTVITILILIF